MKHRTIMVKALAVILLLNGGVSVYAGELPESESMPETEQIFDAAELPEQDLSQGEEQFVIESGMNTESETEPPCEETVVPEDIPVQEEEPVNAPENEVGREEDVSLKELEQSAVREEIAEQEIAEVFEEEDLLQAVNTDDDDAAYDGFYTFVEDGEEYGYESYFDWNYPVHARLYKVTIPSSGKLRIDARLSERAKQSIFMDIIVKKESQTDDLYRWGEYGEVELGSFSKTTGVLSAGTYTVIFSYCKDSSDPGVLWHNYNIKDYFYHYITWQKVDVVNVNGVKLDKTSQTLNVGKTASLKATVSPSNATNKKVTWSSSNTAVASVNSSGVVTAKKAGTATITAKTADGGKTAKCTVTVKNPIVHVTGVKLNSTKLTMGSGQSVTLKATVSPSNAADKKVIWKSSNTKIATVSSSGKVTTSASANGTVRITATTADGKKTATCTITVKKPSVNYRTHVQTYGWQEWKKDGAMSGTSGQSKRLEGINIKLTNQPYSGSIVYRTHVQTYGWQGWKKDGQMSGTTGKAKRLEGIQIYLTGEMAKHYDVYYRVHAQTFGWLGYAKNGFMAGTSGLAKRLEGINIYLVPKGGKAPGATTSPCVTRAGDKLPDNPYYNMQ